ncbi:MAG: thiol oxidoreductase [Gammaproteobacteria bacterium]|nr:MAG: thiol oxidoreductase [Gammaproteobacteria bacterium]
MINDKDKARGLVFIFWGTCTMKHFVGLLLLIATFASAIENNNLINKKDFRLDRPIGKMTNEEQDLFIIGRSFFAVPWVIAPSATTARDGLGPLFNANTCRSCHNGNGVGEKYNRHQQISRAMVTKLSRANHEPIPHYGEQIAVNGTINTPFEAIPTLIETPVPVTYPDGTVVTLKKPTYGLKALNYGPLPDDIIIVQRRAPALIGLGLLTKVSDEEILTYSDPEDKNHDGISGRPNWLDTNKKQLGRFTAKASVGSVVEQTAIAAANDMGLTNPLFPKELCEPEQISCNKAPRGRPDPYGSTLDLTGARLAAITYFVSNTRIPIKQLDASGEKGKQLFKQVGCQNCHRANMTTYDGITFSPYTDLLLHDMGKGLADGRREASADGQEFRTAPLWGLSTYEKTLKSKKPHYLHDARAETLEEAILWHGGEAENSRRKFMALPQKQRQAILAFLNQL